MLLSAEEKLDGVFADALDIDVDDVKVDVSFRTKITRGSKLLFLSLFTFPIFIPNGTRSWICFYSSGGIWI